MAHDEIRRIVAMQDDLQRQAGKEKWPFDAPAANRPRSMLPFPRISAIRLAGCCPQSRQGRAARRHQRTPPRARSITSVLPADGSEPVYSAKEVGGSFDRLLKQEVRGGILDSGVRPDGRTPEEIRPIWSSVGYLPRAHGSAIFTRGQTQVLTIATLGSAGEGQRLDSIGPEDSKRYIHHYNFPPFSVGEVRRMRGPVAARHRSWCAGRARTRAGSSERGRVPVRDAARFRSGQLERFDLDGLGLRQHPGADGRRCPDQGPGCRYRDGS